MRPRRSDSRWPLTVAVVCSALVGAQAGGAAVTRDTSFLNELGVGARPLIATGSTALTVLVMAAQARALKHGSPATMVPGFFAVNAILLLIDWALFAVAPRVAAPALFLLTAGVGPVLGAGFWLVIHERIDPHTAKQFFGRIASAGTIASVAAALAAPSVSGKFGDGAMVPVLAVLSALSAWYVRRLAEPARPIDEWGGHLPLREVMKAPYAISLASIILLITISSTIVEQIMYVRVQEQPASERGEFISVYHAGVNLVHIRHASLLR